MKPPLIPLWAFYTVRAGVVYNFERRLGMDRAEIDATGELWRDVGLDTERGAKPSPFRYRVELETEKDQWTTILDRSQSENDLLNDYRGCSPTSGGRARLVILGWPEGIKPDVAEFTVLGKTLVP